MGGTVIEISPFKLARADSDTPPPSLDRVNAKSIGSHQARFLNKLD